MNSLEFQHHLTIELKDYYNDLINLGLTTEIMQYFMNDAIDIVFEEYYKGFDKNEMVKNGTDSLIVKNEVTVFAPGMHPNSSLFTIPNGIEKTLKEYVMSNGVYINVKPISYDYYDANINNVKRQPFDELFWRMDIGDGDITSTGSKREIIHDGGDHSNMEYHFHYLKRPEKVEFGTVKPIDLKYKPSKEAIKIAAKSIIESYLGKYQNNK